VDPSAPTSRATPWLPLLKAAAHLGESPDSLRKKLERASKRSPDGVIEAVLDGITARKLGRLWKLRLADGWR
jgi:hypothetical protein